MVTIDAGPQDYTGNAVTPDITVRDGGTALTGSTDYTVSYADNVNPGTAMVTVTGKGNYTGTVEKTFTIACRELPSGKNLTDYVDVSPSPNADGWYPSDITLTPKDGCSVGETFTGIGDSVVITGETGADGETETVYIRDGEGNIYQTEFTYKREKTPPVIDLDNMTVESGAEQTVAGLPGTTPAYGKTFAIPVNTDGTHTYYVQATDNAGNESGWQTVTVRLDTGSPEFSGDVSATNRTEEGADLTFTPSEGGKAYWIVLGTGTAPSAQEVVAGAQGGAGKGGVRDVTGSTPDTFTVTGLTPGEKHTVYVVLEDAAGNLSVVKEVTFITLLKAPEITLRDLDIDYEKETAKLPDSFRDAEVYTNPDDPAGSMIQPETDGSLPVEPGTPVYVRYPEKMEGGETTPASGGAKIDIPGRPATPAPKKTAVTDTTVTVTDPAAREEYTPVIKVGGKEMVPGEGTPGSEMTWDGNVGAWEYTYEIPDGASNVQITVEFRKRAVTGIAAAPESLTIYADDAANGSMEALTAYLKDHCNVQTVYDNGTKGTMQETVFFITTDSFVQKGAAYHYTVSAGGRTCCCPAN